MARVALTQQQKLNTELKKITTKYKKLMLAEGITQSKVAELAGVSRQEVSYELNNTISLRVLIVIKELLGEEI